MAYAVITSTSASLHATAIASLPVMSEVSSPLDVLAFLDSWGGTIASAMSILPLAQPCLAISSISGTCSSYWPRKRKPCDRSGRSAIFSLTHFSYASWSFLQSSHWLELSVNAVSLTMVMHWGSGQIASQTPQPQQACRLASYRPSGVTSKQLSGQASQQRVHLMHLSKSTTGRMVRVAYFRKVGLRAA